MRGDLALAEFFDEGTRVVALVRAQGDPFPRPFAAVEHDERGVAFGRAARLGDEHIEHEPVAVLHEDVSPEAESRLLASALARNSCFGVGLRDVRFVGTALTMEVDIGVLAACWWRLVVVARLHALERRPRLEQRPVDGEVVVRGQLRLRRFIHHGREELLSHLVLDQPLPVLGEARVVEGWGGDIHVQEPLEEKVVLEPFAKLAL